MLFLPVSTNSHWKYLFKGLLIGLLLIQSLSLRAANNQEDNIFHEDLSLVDLLKIELQGAGFFKVSRASALGAFHVIDQTQLETLNIRSLSNAIDRLVPGMNVAYHARTNDLLGVRGMQIDVNTKTLLLRDGINTNLRYHAGIIGSDLATTLIGDIERYEVGLSLGSVVHGSGAISGIINQIGATGETRPGYWFQTTYGSGDDITVQGSFGKNFGKSSLFLYAGYHAADGVTLSQPIPRENYPTQSGTPWPASTPSPKFLQESKFGYTPGEVKLSVRYITEALENLVNVDILSIYQHTAIAPTALHWNHNAEESWAQEVVSMQGANLGPLKTNASKSLLIRPALSINVSPKDKIQVTPWFQARSWRIESTPKLDNAVRLLYEIDNTASPLNTLEFGSGETNTGVKALWQTHHIPMSEFALGAEYVHRSFSGPTDFFGSKNGLRMIENMSPDSALQGTWDSIAVYAENTLHWHIFTFITGARYDIVHFNDIRTLNETPRPIDEITNFSGRVGIVSEFIPQHTARLSYQTGFRFPDLNLITYTPADAKQLQPETLESIEFGYSGSFMKMFTVELAAFLNRYKDTLGWVTEPVRGFTNSEEILTTTGTELIVSGQLLQYITARLAYGFSYPLDAHDTQLAIANDDNTWAKFPMHMFKSSLSVTFKGIEVATAIQAMSGAYTQATTAEGMPVTSYAGKIIAKRDRVSMDIKLGYRLHHFNASASCEHILRNNFQYYTLYAGQYPVKAGLRAKNPRCFARLGVFFD